MEKLYYYLLSKSNPLPTLIVKSPTDKAEIKRFLGYEWSTRKGDEGIKYLNTSVQGEDEVLTRKGLDSIQTPLFNPKDLDDTSYINTLVRSYYLGEPMPVSEKLRSYCSTIRMEDMIDFKRTEFDLAISVSQKANSQLQSKYPLVFVRDFVPHIESGSRPKGGVGSIVQGALSLGGEHIDNISGYLNMSSPKYVPQKFYDNSKIYIGRYGEVKNCPEMDTTYGRIDSPNMILKDLFNTPKFRECWYITKDKVDTCQDCEFRYACIDCRCFLQTPSERLSKPRKCQYIP